jgi:hypothetical protein
MKFHQYLSIKENNISAEIEDIFQKTITDIDTLFGQLYKGTEAMVKNGEKAKLPEELQKSIIDDLRKIAMKIKGGGNVPAANVRTDPRMENVMVDAYVKDIIENISAVSGLGKTGTSNTGKPVYDFKSTLNNVKNMVIDRMNQLKGSVLKAMGMVGDMSKQVGDIHGNVVTNMKPQERESAEDGLAVIGNMAKSGGVKLYSGVDGAGKPTGPLSFDPRDRQSIRSLIGTINAKKVYVDMGGKITPIDLTNRQAWTELQSDIQAGTKVEPYAPRTGNQLRMRKMAPGDAQQGIKVNNASQMGS